MFLVNVIVKLSTDSLRLIEVNEGRTVRKSAVLIIFCIHTGRLFCTSRKHVVCTKSDLCDVIHVSELQLILGLNVSFPPKIQMQQFQALHKRSEI